MQCFEYIPPAPSPRIIPERARPSLLAYIRYFQIMARNPLEIWTEKQFENFFEAGQLLGRRYLLVHDPDWVRYYLVTQSENFKLAYIRKALFEPILRDGLIVAEGALWKKTRAALTPVFTPRRVAEFAPVMVSVADKFVGEMCKRAGEEISMSDEMARLTLDILMKCLFSDDAQLDVPKFTRNLDRLFEVAGMPHPMDLIEAPAWVPRFGRSEAMTIVEELREQVAEVVRDRAQFLADGGVPYTDFLTLLLQAGEKEGTPLTESEIIDNLLTFLSAGHETTARSMTWLFYLISQSPDVWSAIVDEVDAVDLSNIPSHQWSDHLPLVTATLKECLRLYPAASILSRNTVRQDEIGGIDVEPGTQIMTSTWVLHRHRKLWRDPHNFDPSRFLGDELKRMPRYAFLPFGAGPRVCIGASFAMTEMVIVFAKAMRKLKFIHTGEAQPQPILRVTLQPSTPVKMRVEKR